VGWLSADHVYAEGGMERNLRARLGQLLENPWNFVLFMGHHTCELCLAHDSNGSLFVPGGNVVFAAPVAIDHYVDVHRYLPPKQFLDAVVDCPPMGSEEYLSALLNAGGKEFGLRTGLAQVHTPCPHCGEPLVTPRAKQCRYCRMDWHDPDHPRKLGERPGT
jgi:hypothetical protein